MGEPKGFLVLPIGYNPSDDLRSLELDASDNLKVVMGDTSLSAILTELQSKVETSDFVSGALSAMNGHKGWIGGAWQKNPLLLGYSAIISKALSNLSAAAGTNYLSSTAVPAGEIWVITTASMLNATTAFTQATIIVSISGNNQYFQSKASPIQNEKVIWNGQAILKEGDTVVGAFDGCTLNDDLYLQFAGYRVDIDQ
jgi:hypothetical protein